MTRPLLVKDLVLPVPAEWTVDPHSDPAGAVRVELRFAVEVRDDRVFVRRHPAPRFEGSILVECEPAEAPLDVFFADRMAAFQRNLPSARVAREDRVEIGGNEAILRDHVLAGPGGALYRQRLLASMHRGSVYVLGTTNTAGPAFDAAAHVFEACLARAAWCVPESEAKMESGGQEA